jgi:hypothetical protein
MRVFADTAGIGEGLGSFLQGMPQAAASLTREAWDVICKRTPRSRMAIPLSYSLDIIAVMSKHAAPADTAGIGPVLPSVSHSRSRGKYPTDAYRDQEDLQTRYG